MLIGVDYAADEFGGSKAKLAQVFNITPQAITKWMHEGIPADRCITLHIRYGLELSRLNPKKYGEAV